MISIVILTKNEEKNILKCLNTCLFADEIIIVDDYSRDDTVKISKSLNSKKIKVIQRKLDSNFAAQRNFGLEQTTHEWVLFVDADETISKKLQEEIKKAVSSKNSIQGFFVKRVDILWGKKMTHGELLNFKILRLGRKDSGVWVGKVHEEWKIKGSVGFLENELIHTPHSSIKEFLFEINFYSSIRAKELFENGVKTNAALVLFYPKAKFVLNYFVKLGFLDGVEGLLLSILMSLHAFLVRSKLYFLQKNKK